MKKYYILLATSFILFSNLNTSSACDESLVIDRFDFLRTKYPELVELANQPYQDCQEEKKHHTVLASAMQKTQETQEVTLFNEAKNFYLIIL